MQNILVELKELLSKEEPNYTEILELLKLIYEEDEKEFEKILKSLNSLHLGNLAALMPEYMLEIILKLFSLKKIARAASKLESDDATDLIQAFEDIDKNKAAGILANIDKKDKEEIIKLKKYKDDTVGAYMQTELFTAFLDEKISKVIQKYRSLKKIDAHTNVMQIFVIDEKNTFFNSIELSELLLHDENTLMKDLISKKELIAVKDLANINEAIELVQDYDLSVLAVISEDAKLLGRITYDDIHDLIKEQATEQLYNLAGVDDEAEEEGTIVATKARSLWLMINLITSLISAHIISLFSGEIEKLVALAALMPIVASMGGNTGSQALAVTVRRLSLNEIDFSDAKRVIQREIQISSINGTVFALVIGVIAYLWFDLPLLGFVIALSMLINLSLAGFLGSFIPLFLKRLSIDPAVGSSVLLTAITDALGFFCFLLLAKLILL